MFVSDRRWPHTAWLASTRARYLRCSSVYACVKTGVVGGGAGPDEQVARGEAAGARPRHGSAQRADAPAEQRAAASRVRAEGERGRPVDRAAPRRRRDREHAARQARGQPVAPVRARQGGRRVPTQHGRAGTLQPGHPRGDDLRQPTHALHDGGRPLRQR